ncbi:unnamed protein product, partial [Rotaria sp. Silwood1]
MFVSFTVVLSLLYTHRSRARECFCIGRTCPDGCDSDRDCCTTTVDGIRYVGYCLERFNSAYCRYRPSF